MASKGQDNEAPFTGPGKPVIKGRKAFVRQEAKMKGHPKIGITLGDPAGIGPEIVLKAYTHRLPRHVPIIFGDPNILEAIARSLRPRPRVRVISSIGEATLTNAEGIHVFPVTNLPPGAFRPGKVTAETGQAAGKFIEAAIQAALGGEIQAVVTCPIHKQAFHKAGYPYPGHTEMFAALTGTKRFGMMMVSRTLVVSLATLHLPLREVPERLSQSRIETILDLTRTTLTRWFGIHRPKICVLGLNPHAGEGGDMGREEKFVIDPAIASRRKRGFRITGPLPADTAFIKKNLKRFDAFVAMYHDQGLIPFKLLAFRSGVNLTMGLPFPRVSVDHGTGLDIAGKNTADPASLRSAIRWAVSFVRANRPA